MRSKDPSLRSASRFVSIWRVGSAVAAVLALSGPTLGDIVNPGFETGDLAPWVADGFGVFAGDSSDGTFHAQADVAGYLDGLTPATDTATLSQTFDVPADVKMLSVDISHIAVSSGGDWGLSATLTCPGNGGLIVIDILAGLKTNAPNWFSRYTQDVSACAGKQAELLVTVFAEPGANAAVRVDNVVLDVHIPEPTALALVVSGAVLSLLGRPRIRRSSRR